MNYREEESCHCTNLVKLEMRVQRNVLVEGELFELCDEVPGHSEKKKAVTECERVGSAPSDGNSNTHDFPQIRVLSHE